VSPSYRRALLHVIALLGGSIAWALLIGVVSGVVLVLSGASPDPTQWAGRWVGLLSIVQIAGFALWGLLLQASGPTDEATFTWPRMQRVREGLALEGVPLGATVLAFAASLTVWMLPSYAVTRLLELTGGDGGSMEWIAELLLGGEPIDRWVMGVAVVGSAPLFEELIFRGYLWHLWDRAGGPRVALLATTALFALYHLDPLHIVALLPVAVLIGWFRWMSGSLWPALAAHFGNNAVSAAVVLTQPAALAEGPPLWLGLAGALWSVVCCVVAARWARAPEST
jgi:membrane protease YdiL (CAAX protease family)